ncbi:MAG TPA: DHH family phosphoesterase [Candidatus Saccharimonadales bacterium]|jgi:phosphoesterase RecJ-like protein|nr:DHH family phosphoesterase [Candidatus Saccharimonadales bacterium]
MYPEADKIKNLLNEAQSVVIVQADNPDADSLGSALAIEQILGDLGKEPYLYCGVDVPTYLRYMAGWDRVDKELPHQFDASIIVDASTMTLLERLSNSGQQGWLAAKPCLVLDHHETVENVVPFANVTINDHTRASTGELIYLVGQQLKWPLSVRAQEFLMLSILGDTQGLSNQLASPGTYRIVADMIEAGVDRGKLEEQRRELAKMPVEIFKYKADLIKRAEFSGGGKVASVTVPQAEINSYSPLYNPAPLVQGDMLQTAGVEVAIVFKTYDSGKITAAIRCNPSAGIAADLAEHFGGGGHAFASGFKIEGNKSFDQVKADCLTTAADLLAKLKL